MIAVEVHGAGVYLEQPAFLVVDQEEGVGDHLEEFAVFLFALPQGLLGAPQFFDLAAAEFQGLGEPAEHLVQGHHRDSNRKPQVHPCGEGMGEEMTRQWMAAVLEKRHDEGSRHAEACAHQGDPRAEEPSRGDRNREVTDGPDAS